MTNQETQIALLKAANDLIKEALFMSENDAHKNQLLVAQDLLDAHRRMLICKLADNLQIKANMRDR